LETRIFQKSLICFLITLFSISLCFSGEEKDTTKVFKLGEIVVVGQQDNGSTPFQQGVVSQTQLQQYNRIDASRALNLLPGLSLSNVGGRNESMVYVRGFDLRQVPVFIDGIPEYVPYDGYVDLARFTAFDLSEITVTKGFSSVLYGPNAMGGAINLVSRKPSVPLEYDLSTGIMNTAGRDVALNLGTNQGMYYLMGSASSFDQNSYPLSNSFIATKTQKEGERDNSYRKDTKFNLKAGFTPNETDEYSFSYINQRGEKGNPVYAGVDPKSTVRYWQWPNWDKFSEYFISQTLLGDKDSHSNVVLKTRLFHDKFKNTVFAYDNATYTTQLKKSSFQSYYDDDTWGAVVEAKTKFIDPHQLTLAFHWKHDIHREHNLGEPERTDRDAIISIGAEDVYRVQEQLALIGGVSYDIRNSLQAENYNSKTLLITNFPDNDSHAWNVQFGAIYELSSERQLSFSIARKTRFSTMKDRYSYKLGTALPNPDLTPEYAVNYDLAYREIVSGLGTYKLSAFYNDIRDVIQQVSNVSGNLSQMQNLGKARYYGAEVEVESKLTSEINAGANYTFLKRENISNPGVLFLDTPVHKIFLHADVTPIELLSVTGSMEYNTERNSTSDGVDVAGAFALFNLKASLNFYQHITVDAGVQNIFDRNYSLVEGYPEAGRTYFATLRLHE
jgi:iron complex outermembrane receptor protein